MREKVGRIIFVLCIVVPLAIVLFSGVFGLVFGANGLFGSELSGWDAFYSNVFWTSVMLVIIPVIPLCIVYIIAFLLRRFVKPVREMPLRRYIIIVVCIVAVIAAVVLVMSFRFEIDAFFDKRRAHAMVRKADDMIEYNLHSFYCSGIYGMEEHIHDCVLIDHDRMVLGILFNADFDEYSQYKLKEGSHDSGDVKRITEEYYVNAVIPLSAPLKRLISFYPKDESYSHRTIAFVVEAADGSVYYADDLSEIDHQETVYFCFRGSEYYIDGNVKYDDLP